jgi:hypothetical protein
MRVSCSFVFFPSGALKSSWLRTATEQINNRMIVFFPLSRPLLKKAETSWCRTGQCPCRSQRFHSQCDSTWNSVIMLCLYKCNFHNTLPREMTRAACCPFGDLTMKIQSAGFDSKRDSDLTGIFLVTQSYTNSILLGKSRRSQK